MASTAYVWHFEAFYRHLPFLFAGIRYTVLVSVLTIVPGRATRLQGGVHLVLLAAFLFLAVNP